MTHANFEFGETNGRCNNCSSRTALISIYGSGNVDQEPFATGECAEESAEHQCGVEIPESVEFNDEITAHFCFQCNCLTTLCINAEKRNKQEKIDIDLEIALFKHRLSEHSVDIDVIVLSDSTTASPSQGGDYQIQLLKAELADAGLSPDDNSDTVPMPRELTAEQGFKYALIGEFSESHEVVCPYCDLGLINTEYDDIDDETCPECEGEYIHTVDWDISWKNIKAIYKAAVAHFHPVSDEQA